MKRDIYDRIKAALTRLNNSRDVNFTTVIVAWDKHRRFSVECIRSDCGDITDEHDNVVHERAGRPIEFEVYYQVDGDDKDCCTLAVWLGDEEFKSLREFVDMYR